MQSDSPRRYGVIEQTAADTDIAYTCESIRHLGYGVINGGYEPKWLAALPDAFERAHQRHAGEHGGPQALQAIDEHNTIRLPLAYEPVFLELAANGNILEICKQLIAGYAVLN